MSAEKGRPARSRAKHVEEAALLEHRVLDLLLARKAQLLGYLERRVGSRADAEDLLQAAMLRLLDKGKSVRQREKLVPWFYRLLQNLIVDWYRSRAAAGKLRKRLKEEPPPAGDAWPDLLHEACACVLDVLVTLKPAYADIVQRVDLDDQPLSTAARELRISVGNVSVRLHRARRALLKGLHALCGACLEHRLVACDCRRTPGGGRARTPIQTGV
jgi:RNA polymerase sigma-70 factor (ECF subfamily)